MRLRVGAIGAKGDGVCAPISGDDGEPAEAGRDVYVAYTAPGDVIDAQVAGDRGRMTALVAPGPDRAPPPCAHYGVCGGCALQHVTSSFYRRWKHDQVVDALRVAGLDTDGLDDGGVAPLVEIDPASRRRAHFYVERFAVDAPGAEVSEVNAVKDGAVKDSAGNDSAVRDGGVRLGFYERRSRRLVAVETCVILHPALSARLEALAALAAAAPAGWPRFALAVTLCDNGLDIDFAAKAPLGDPAPAEIERLASAMPAASAIRLCANGAPLIARAAPVVSFAGVAVTPPPGGFLQASVAGQDALIALVAAAMKGARRIVDLFSGCGAFTAPLARAATLTAYDSDEAAIAALKAGAAAARADGLKPVTAHRRDLFERPLTPDELAPFDGAVIDPPRAGAIHQARLLAASTVPRVAYVSCNPKTFARDAAILIDSGYRLKRVTPVDQFAYSPHIELVGEFDRR